MGKVLPFLTGATIGALAALAFAPQSGEETRSFVAEKATAVAGEAKDAAGKGVGMLKEVPAKAQGVVGSVAGGADGASAASQSDDELREKIEAARRRIAAQVMENAEQSQAVEVEAAPEAEEAPAAE